MWRLWSKPLEALGRLRFPRILPGILFRRRVEVGQPGAPDGRGGAEWRDFLKAEPLYDAWSPHPEGPWIPYHCVPLFAALDRLDHKAVGPAPPPGSPLRKVPPPELPDHARPGAPAPRWLKPGSWVILDLAGPRSVEAAAWLADAAGCQPVSTFDNWPHARGVLKPEDSLAELLRWASLVKAARARMTPTSPPVWICDRSRLGEREGRPGEFDNRYYLDDSVLPGPQILARSGVREVLYIVQDPAEMPLLDLEWYFSELLKLGIPIHRIVLSGDSREPQFLSSPPMPRPPPRMGFRRSSAGGFGTEVPQPSSGGGGGG